MATNLAIDPKLIEQARKVSDDSRTHDDSEGGPPVSLLIRAFPLRELLSLAYENRYDVIWRERNP